MPDEGDLFTPLLLAVTAVGIIALGKDRMTDELRAAYNRARLSDDPTVIASTRARLASAGFENQASVLDARLKAVLPDFPIGRTFASNGIPQLGI